MVDPSNRISTSQEDYLETVLRLEREQGEVRISDIADRLGVRLPSVTRAVQALARRGYVQHEARREVRLTEEGRRMACALSHRHEDICSFLTEVLGVPRDVAETDACQMEHGLSPITAQRLHEFLEHFARLDEPTRDQLLARRRKDAFEHLPKGRSAGWRA